MANNDITLDLLEETRFKKKHTTFIKKMTNKTHFSELEIESILIIYYKIFKDGQEKHFGITKDQFRDILHCGFNMMDEHLLERIFTALERGQSHSSIISMETWCHALSLFLRGSLEEKIHHCFAVYDIMGDGMIGRDAMFQLLKSAVITPGSDDEAEEAIKDLIEVLTKKLDIDRDGKVSFNDYRESVMNQPMLLEALGRCLPSRYNVVTFLTTFTFNIGKT